jgi:hypothetical protein
MDKSDTLELEGGCHCKKIRFKVNTKKEKLTVFKCNCSICIMKQNHHFIVHKDKFILLEGEEYLSTYTFNKNQAQHRFCKVCGVQCFYHPRSHPEGRAITIYCLDDYPNVDHEIVEFDGQNWEKEIKSNVEINKEI